MREIKFRAKQLFTGTIGSDKWIFGENVRLLKAGDMKSCFINGKRCDYETLGQYTGLKNAYDGDIVKTIYGIGVIGWYNNGWVIWQKDRSCGVWPLDYCEKILGNIYDNQELIKEAEQCH